MKSRSNDTAVKSRVWLAPASSGRAFTLPEVAAALIILALITSSVLVVVNRCTKAAIDRQLKIRAYQIARENMEKLLAAGAVEETLEQGIDELNPNIEWQTVVEPFYEPTTSRMWIRAVCSARYADSHDEEQTVEFTHWLTNLTKKQILALAEQKRLMQEQTLADIKEFVRANIDTLSEDTLLQLYDKMTDEDLSAEDANDFQEIKNYILTNLDDLDYLDEDDTTVLADLYNQFAAADVSGPDADGQPRTDDSATPDKQPPGQPDSSRREVIPGYTEAELEAMPAEQMWKVITEYLFSQD